MGRSRSRSRNLPAKSSRANPLISSWPTRWGGTAVAAERMPTLPENGSITLNPLGGGRHLPAVLGSEAEESRRSAEHQVQEVVRQVYVNQTEQHLVADEEAGDEAQNRQQQIDEAHPLQVDPRPPNQSSDDAEDAEQKVHQVVEHVNGEDAEQLTPRRVQDEAQNPHRQKRHPEHQSNRPNHIYSFLSDGRSTRASGRWRDVISRFVNHDSKVAAYL